jgi:hypothetical protein
MTRPAPWRRSTAAERRQARADFKAVKLAVANSPETQALRIKARGDDARARAQKKLKRILAGPRDDVRPFSATELAKLKATELIRLRQHSARRFHALTDEQRARLSRNVFLLLICVNDEKYRAVADFDPPAR